MKATHTLIAAFAAASAMFILTGCGGGEEKTANDKTTAKSETPGEGGGSAGGHAHGEGPHGGTVADWGGGKFHVEFTVDHDKKETAVYVLGSDEKTPVPIQSESVLLTINEPEFQIELKPRPLEGEADGASRFVGTHDSLGIVREFAGSISAEVDGTPYVGEFTEEAYGAVPHTHGEDDALVWEGDPVEHAGTTILLGHHGKHLHAGEEVEPAVSIVREDGPVADAKVFNALLSADGKTVLAEEVATVYEPTTDEEPAHYAQGSLVVPEDVKKVIIRFRIVLTGEDAKTLDVPIDVE